MRNGADSFTLLFLHEISPTPLRFSLRPPTAVRSEILHLFRGSRPLFQRGIAGSQGQSPFSETLSKSLVKRVLGSKAKPWSSPGRRSGGDWGRAPSAEGSRQGRNLQTVLYQPKAEGIAGTYKLYHISRKHLRALSEINFYSETVKFSFFDFCFGFAETGFCCKPSASLFGAPPQAPLAAPRQTRPRLRLGSKDAFPERDFLRDFREGALPL